jgi:hypothetical protein
MQTAHKFHILSLRVYCYVAHLDEALRYKPEGRGFDSRWCHWNFSLTYSFRPHCGPGVDSAANKNEYQEYFLGGKGGRCVGLTTLPPSCADYLEIWESQPPGTLWACPGLYRDCFTFTFNFPNTSQLRSLCNFHAACIVQWLSWIRSEVTGGSYDPVLTYRL